jgi:hypothetical protein
MVSATTALPGIICAGWNAKGPRLLAGARRGDTVIPWANRRCSCGSRSEPGQPRVSGPYLTGREGHRG